MRCHFTNKNIFLALGIIATHSSFSYNLLNCDLNLQVDNFFNNENLIDLFCGKKYLNVKL